MHLWHLVCWAFQIFSPHLPQSEPTWWRMNWERKRSRTVKEWVSSQTKKKKVSWSPDRGPPPHTHTPPPWLTLSWDLDTLPLFSRSRAVKPYQMDLSSSDRRSMSAAQLLSGFLLYVSSSSLCCWHGAPGWQADTHTVLLLSGSRWALPGCWERHLQDIHSHWRKGRVWLFTTCSDPLK